MAEYSKDALCKDKVWGCGDEKHGTAYDQHRKPVEFSRAGSGLKSFKKANLNILEDPLVPQTESKMPPAPVERELGLTFTDLLENRTNMSFECTNGHELTQSDEKVERSEACQISDCCSTIGTSCNNLLLEHTCTVAGQRWTDECLGLADQRATLSSVGTVAQNSQLCDVSAVQRDAVCKDHRDSSYSDQKDSDSKRFCAESNATVLSTCSRDETYAMGGSVVIHSSVISTGPDQTDSAVRISSKGVAKRLKLSTKDDLKKAHQDRLKTSNITVNTPRLSTEDEFNCSSITLQSDKIFIGRLFTQASDVKVGPLELTASLSAGNVTYNLKIEIKDITEWKGDFSSEPFALALKVVSGTCQKLVNHLSAKFHLNNYRFYNSGSPSTFEKFIVVQLTAPLNERQAATLCDIIEQHKGCRGVEINLKASLHELLCDVVAKQLDPRSLHEEKKVLNQLELVHPCEEKMAVDLSVSPNVTYKTRSLSKQALVLEQSSIRRSINEPSLCTDDHKKVLSYNPSGSKLHFEISIGDLSCLNPQECLNDKIINFYLAYLLFEQFATIKEKVHIFSSFFLGKLMESSKTCSRSCSEGIHDKVKSWTRHVDIFSKDYIVMPVCLRSHWFVVIVCLAGKFDPCHKRSRQPLFRSPQQQTNTSTTFDTKESVGNTAPIVLSTQEELVSNSALLTASVLHSPCIVVLDSLGIQRAEVLRRVRRYLTEEWKVKRSTEKNFTSMPQSYPSVPLQNNNVDCGIYVLQYVESFLKSIINSNSMPQSKHEWASDDDLSQKRVNIRTLIESLGENRN